MSLISQRSSIRPSVIASKLAQRLVTASTAASSRFSSTQVPSGISSAPPPPQPREPNKSVRKTEGSDEIESLAEVSAENPPSDPRTLLEDSPYIVKILWPHPGYKPQNLREVDVAHLKPSCMQDKVAYSALRIIRWSFDRATGYKEPPEGEEDSAKYRPTPTQWLRRFVFLESVAGVPGMVGGMVRHLHSLRLLRRDNAWMESLSEEAYNERMHLMSFMKITSPGWFMRLNISAAQGIFFNCFFSAYLVFPRVCHRFVGYLEEEAIKTYSRCIEHMEAGSLPEFSEAKAPDVALNYWRMEPGSSVKDMIYYIRADEAKHCEVNHTLGNSKQKTDPNPYALDYSNLPANYPRPTDDLKYSRQHPVGWKREEIKF